MTHPLRVLLDAAARGVFPPNDWRTEVLPAPERPRGVIVGMTGHAVIAAAVGAATAREVRQMDPVTAMHAPTLARLAERLDARLGTYDAVFVACGTGEGTPAWLHEHDEYAHARVERALRHRKNARIFTAGAGDAVLVVGQGLCDRWEFGYEVEAHARNAGLGRRLAAAARALVPAGEPVWAQVAPGNAASMRSIVAAGFVPIGAEVLFVA
jgi:hypothetical protein